jgi:cholesterol transport system auxiliary component
MSGGEIMIDRLAAMRRWGLAATLLGLGLGLCGCVSLLPKAKPIQLYAFGQLPPPPPGEARPGAVGIVLGGVTMPAAAVGDQILTVTGQDVAYIAGARWVVPAGLMVQGDAERAFEAKGQRVRLLHRGDLGGAAAVLRLDVGDFEARYATPGAAPTIVVSLRASLTRPDGALIAAQTFTARQPAAENRIVSIASAYDKAVIDVLDQVVAWTDAHAPAAPAEPTAVTTPPAAQP